MLFQIPVSAIAYPNINPIAFSLGPFEVHWYGISYVVGILFALWYSKRLVNNKSLWPQKAPIKENQLDDFLIWAVLGVVLGGRLGYVLFYDFSLYLQNPSRIALLWQGGMSFHGGLLGVIIAMILFARRNGFSVFSLFDVIGPSATIGLLLGRIANFINQELFGKPTDVPWGVIFPVTGDNIPRHPSQLYEGLLEGLLLFFVLRLCTHHFKMFKQPGFVAGVFVAGYALARIAVEFVRLPDAHIGYLFGGWLTMGMVLSLPILLVGLWSILTSKNRGKHG